MGVRRGSAPRESLSTFFSEESRGPSRPERQVKRSLRGKSQTGKGEREKEKAAHPVSSFAQSRTPAIDFGRRPALSFCFPGQGKCLVSVPCGMEETRRAKAPARPPRTETLEKLSFAPWLFKRGCAGQVALRVSCLPVSRTHAAGSGCKPTHGSCFPGQRESLVSVPCGREETRRAKAPARPQRTETLEKLSSAPWLFKRFPYLPAVCGRMAA